MTRSGVRSGFRQCKIIRKEMRYGIHFTKAQASGNDFVVIDNKDGSLGKMGLNYSDMAKDLCRRSFSVGADGILVLESSAGADFRMRIINPDGSEVDMCGNGARCSAYYASQKGWGDSLKIETGAGIIEASVKGKEVKLRMSDPKDMKLGLNLGVGCCMITVHFLNTGVPHAVHIVDDLESYPVVEIGRGLRYHTAFSPGGTNANFVGDIGANSASLRTYERGVEDETLACGTGTVASAVVLGLLGKVKSPVRMKTRGGEVLTVHFNVSGSKVTDVYLQGEAHITFEGKV